MSSIRYKQSNIAPTLIPINQEEIYQLMTQKKWSELIILLHDYHKIILTDSLLEDAFRIFASELLCGFAEFSTEENFERDLSFLYLIHTCRMYQFPVELFEKIVVGMVRVYEARGQLELAYNCARQFPTNVVCSDAIVTFEKSLPKVVEHSQSRSIRVTENKNVSSDIYTVSLFKSEQERDFFMAVRDVFPMFIVYPNVALSCLVDFDKIKHALSVEECEYFFKAVVDCVVFDQYKDYIPVYFFELDSSSHDTEKQKTKDGYKDRILALSGQKLFRIRRIAVSQKQREFMQLVREVLRSDLVKE